MLGAQKKQRGVEVRASGVGIVALVSLGSCWGQAPGHLCREGLGQPAAPGFTPPTALPSGPVVLRIGEPRPSGPRFGDRRLGFELGPPGPCPGTQRKRIAPRTEKARGLLHVRMNGFSVEEHKDDPGEVATCVGSLWWPRTPPPLPQAWPGPVLHPVCHPFSPVLLPFLPPLHLGACSVSGWCLLPLGRRSLAHWGSSWARFAAVSVKWAAEVLPGEAAFSQNGAGRTERGAAGRTACVMGPPVVGSEWVRFLREVRQQAGTEGSPRLHL